MTTDYDDIEKLAPHKLVANFTKNRVLLCTVIALAVHALVISVTSIDYLYYNVINQEAGRLREERIKNEEQAKKDAERKKLQQKAEASRVVRTQNSGTADNLNKNSETDMSNETLMDKYKDTPVVKSVTDAAKPEEIPDAPDNLNISIKDTGI
ncbi:MAG: hypothetical protein JXN60_05015 [Lentisphaerae bacterium]|nr:hypothetical protein [Lentisphaerota bacterium]